MIKDWLDGYVEAGKKDREKHSEENVEQIKHRNEILGRRIQALRSLKEVHNAISSLLKDIRPFVDHVVGLENLIDTKPAEEDIDIISFFDLVTGAEALLDPLFLSDPKEIVIGDITGKAFNPYGYSWRLNTYRNIQTRASEGVFYFGMSKTSQGNPVYFVLDENNYLGERIYKMIFNIQEVKRILGLIVQIRVERYGVPHLK